MGFIKGFNRGFNTVSTSFQPGSNHTGFIRGFIYGFNQPVPITSSKPTSQTVDEWLTSC